MQSYSQHGQDTFVYETFFKGRTDPGTFVDVGAYDGITFSNTLLFERLGWSGVCIEPLPAAFEKLKATRSSICVNCAIADSPGTGTLVQIDMPSGFEQMYSGLKANFDERHRKTIEKWGSNLREVTVQIRRLADILAECGVRRVDYLSIDTEGSEWRILRAFDLGAFAVQVVSVENNYGDVKIHRHMHDRGYRLVKAFGGFDELYVKTS